MPLACSLSHEYRPNAPVTRAAALSSGRSGVLSSGRAMRRTASIPSVFSCRNWNRAFVRAIAPRRFFRVLPTRTRPSLFGSD